MKYFTIFYKNSYKYLIMKALEIKENRKNAGLTQEQLAKMLGVSKRTIINYEKGEIIPDTKNELLHSIFKNENINLFKEPNSEYILIDKSEEKINQIEEIIKEREKIKLLDPRQTKHQNEMITLLKIQIQLIKENKNNIDK